MRVGPLVAAFTVLLVGSLPASPRILSYQGNLTTPNGPPVADGAYNMRFSLHNHPTAGALIWTETDAQVAVVRGLFSTTLGDGNPIPVAVFTSNDDLWLEVAVDLDRSSGFDPAEVYAPRQRLTAAAWATDAERLQGRAPSDFAAVAHTHAWGDIAAGAPNIPPVALLEAQPDVLYISNDRPASTVLNLSQSYDPEGGPLSYRYQGRFVQRGLPPPPWSEPATRTVVFAESGDHLIAGWVRDDRGAVQRSEALVSVLAFASTVVDSPGNVGEWPSLRMVEGLPAIAYFKRETSDLMYVRAGDAVGASWGTPITVQDAGSVGFFADMTVVDGRPAIAYRDNTLPGLRYIRALDSTGDQWPLTPVTIEAGSGAGTDVSLAIVDGRPAVAHWHQGAGRLRYARANDATGAAWAAPTTLEATGIDAQPSLAVVNGHPAIAYRGSDGRLKYVRALDITGAAWGAPVHPEPDTAWGLSMSLAVASGRPAIAYRQGDPGRLRYVRAADANGDAWATPVQPDPQLGAGTYADLDIIANRPAIAYQGPYPGALMYVRATDAAGSVWDAPLIIQDGYYPGVQPSLEEIGGRPAIAYRYNGILNNLCFVTPRRQ